MRAEPVAVVTGTMLRDLVVCERRVWHDVHGDRSLRDPVASFVQLLWAGGTAHEKNVLATLAGRVVDLRDMPSDRIEAATLDALASDADHVLGGRIAAGGLVATAGLVVASGFLWGTVEAGALLVRHGLGFGLGI